jgi:hypothetical protein
MAIELTRRTADVVTGADDLEPLYTLERFPVFMGTTTQPPERDLFAPMEWMISRSSGVIQLGRLLPLDLLYGESHGSGSVGGLWQRHHDEFASFISRYEPKSILEIGGGHGRLATAYARRARTSWTIIEPNPSPGPDCTATFIKGFFDSSFRPETPFDTIVHSHVLEHLYNPRDFVKQAGSILEPGQRMFFSVPNLERMLELGYTNAINFEHTALLGDAHIRRLLRDSGFAVIDCRRFLDDHSIFYSTMRVEAVVGQPFVEASANQRGLYGRYVETHLDLVRTLNERLSNASSATYVFGAHVFAQYLFAFGLDSRPLTAILDNDPRKQGQRLYGTSLRVESPAVVANCDAPIVILKAGVYNDEIRRQLFGLNATTVFLE